MVKRQVHKCFLKQQPHMEILFICWLTWNLGYGQVLVDFQENPKAAQEHSKNPQVMSKIQKLVSAGIVQIK